MAGYQQEHQPPSPPSSAHTYLFIGNPGAGKSALLNGLIGEFDPPRFKSGVCIGKGLTQVLQSEAVPGKGIFVDTPGFADIKIREQAAREISTALQQDGTYHVFFVLDCQRAGRILAEDKTTLGLVINACRDVPGFAYSVIFNKVSPSLMKKFVANEAQNGDSVGCKHMMSNLLNEDLDIKTTSIHYLRRIDEIEDQNHDASTKYEIPKDTLDFILGSPSVRIQPGQAHVVQHDQFAEMEEKYGAQIQSLTTDLKHQQEVNASLGKEMESMRVQMQKKMDAAAKSREEDLKRFQEAERVQKEELEKMRLQGIDAQQKNKEALAQARKEHNQQIDLLKKQHEEAQKRNAEMLEELRAPESMGNWATGNRAGSTMIEHNKTPYTMTSVGVYEQPNFGIIDIAVNGHRFTNNNNGRLVETITVPYGKHVIAVEVKEQPNYGIVDLRLRFNDNSPSNWATGNTHGNLKTANAPGKKVTGMRIKEQANYGIIDVDVFAK